MDKRSQSTDAADSTPAVAAVHYRSGALAPKLVAKGRGEVAEAILARARELGIPTKSEPALINFLLELDLNQLIPSELYEAIAEVLAWAYEVDQSESSRS